jgi:hypothetical protein
MRTIGSIRATSVRPGRPMVPHGMTTTAVPALGLVLEAPRRRRLRVFSQKGFKLSL